jgi:ATP-dependent DNA helicase RecG
VEETPAAYELEELLRIIRKPLTFASRDDFAHLHAVKGFQSLVTSWAERAQGLPIDRGQKELVRSVAHKFDSFESLTEAMKKAAINESLTILEELEKSLGRTGARPGGSLETMKGELRTPIQFVKGVGPKGAKGFERKGVGTVEDALYFLPIKYEDRREIKGIGELKAGELATVMGTILASGMVNYKRRRKGVFEMVIEDDTGMLRAKWFSVNKPFLDYMKKRFRQGQKVILSGEVSLFRQQKEIHHPEMEHFDESDRSDLSFGRIVPKYSETEGIYQKQLRKIMFRVVSEFGRSVPDGIPESIARRRELVPLSEAIEHVHFPGPSADIEVLREGASPGHRRLVFDEFFFLELGLALKKRGLMLEEGIAFRGGDVLCDRLKKMLPFSLTGAQQKVVQEIRQDMGKPHPMNRLLQGDVGSGKTLVALFASLVAIENGYQAVFMAPTEILAEQHFATLSPLMRELNLKVALLTGGAKGSRRSRLNANILSGDVHIVVGTHALIQEGVEFSRLGLAVIDEQHKFGVLQRAILKKRVPRPDVLVMTATPIPRTLGLTLYGDLDVSIMDELPPGRKRVKTRVFHERDRKKVYGLIEEEAQGGRQVYIVYPLIEESEKMDLMNATHMAEHLAREVFPQFRVGLVHGRMARDEKERVMSDFQRGAIPVLVSTTVVEVGVDVSNATMMVVEHAERFGLSQLHQLRGRVGRGEARSQCILLAQYRKSDDARRRLRIMEHTTDGFRIAEEDFAIRGPGEFFGTRQSGFPDFRVASLGRDTKTLHEAREEAFRLVSENPDLSGRANELTRAVLKDRWEEKLELAHVG